jgi:hypothetical protein
LLLRRRHHRYVTIILFRQHLQAVLFTTPPAEG